MEDFRESSNITETPHEEKWRDDWLELPQSLNKKTKNKKGSRGKTYHTNERTAGQINEEKIK